ncbi:DUF1330 domain-containing protein [Burkholderia sp. Ac-20379]|uniref:DUF1330 domain-containing protein n=1 Tax=Burkholderia sp. Ac-20379 TaxID=2703900 RepID=UPI00198153F4|nr:DUF1330 domain-containing protein [Burkholderia sp. Ac-20379]MBN3726805.1 DUF1330 domain-containing protein [Burkholderia sp. Ac-20379]
MKGYWVVLGGDVTDPDSQKQYGALWAPIAEKYQAKLKVLDAKTVLAEALDTQRVLLVEFPSLDAAKACYADSAYQEAKAVALKAYRRELLIVEGDFA